MNENRMVTFGDELPNPNIMETSGKFTPTSKYMNVEDIGEVYGKSALFLSELEREVAINIAEGVRYKALANLLDLDERVIKVVANRKHVRKFIQEYVAESTAVLKAKREMYLAQIIEARLDKVTDMANASELDTATLISMLDSVQKEKEKAELQKTNTNQIVNVLQMITKD